MPAESRRLVIKVQNRSAMPVPLEVVPPGLGGNIGKAIGPASWVGVAEPSVIPPGVTQPVVFLVPPTEDWAIYANGGELFGPAEIRGMGAELPVGIDIDNTGNPSSGPWP